MRIITKAKIWLALFSIQLLIRWAGNYKASGIMNSFSAIMFIGQMKAAKESIQKLRP